MTLTSDQVEELMAWARNQAPGRRLRYEIAAENQWIDQHGCRHTPVQRTVFRAWCEIYATGAGATEMLLAEKRLL